MVEVSDGTITCPGVCSIMYGTDANNRNLPAVSGQLIPGLLPDETYFYLVTQTIDSQMVEVEGSFMSGVWNICSYEYIPFSSSLVWSIRVREYCTLCLFLSML